MIVKYVEKFRVQYIFTTLLYTDGTNILNYTIEKKFKKYSYIIKNNKSCFSNIPLHFVT